jgi:hypothetical protein
MVAKANCRFAKGMVIVAKRLDIFAYHNVFVQNVSDIFTYRYVFVAKRVDIFAYCNVFVAKGLGCFLNSLVDAVTSTVSEAYLVVKILYPIFQQKNSLALGKV